MAFVWVYRIVAGINMNFSCSVLKLPQLFFELAGTTFTWFTSCGTNANSFSQPHPNNLSPAPFTTTIAILKKKFFNILVLHCSQSYAQHPHLLICIYLQFQVAGFPFWHVCLLLFFADYGHATSCVDFNSTFMPFTFTFCVMGATLGRC